MPTGGSAGIPEPLPVDVDDSTPVEVNVQEPVSVDDNGGSLTVDDGGGSLTVDGTVTVSNPSQDVEIEVVCDGGNANQPFLRRYLYDETGALTSVLDTELDATTPYVEVGPVVRCDEAVVSGSVSVSNFPAVQPVNDNGGSLTVDDGGGSLTVDGTVDVGNQFDDEWQILCDSTPTIFLRRLRTNAAGVVTVANFTLAGGAFAPVGAVGTCVQTVSGTVAVSSLPEPVSVDDNGGSLTVDDGGGSLTVDGLIALSNQFDDEWEVLCDSTPTTFMRRYRTDSAGVVTVANFTLAGAAFVPVGAVGNCSNRRDVFDQILCDTVTTFLRRYTVNDAGVVTITDTTLDGTTAYVPVGAVNNCAGDSRNDSFQVLCDNNGSFIRRYAVSGSGVLTVTNLTLAGAAYVPVGTVTQCGKNTGSITVTLLSGVASLVSSVLARRITFIFGNNDATAANRPAINGVATLESPNGVSEQINVIVIGSLDSPNTLPAITFQTREAGDSANVIQEF